MSLCSLEKSPEYFLQFAFNTPHLWASRMLTEFFVHFHRISLVLTGSSSQQLVCRIFWIGSYSIHGFSSRLIRVSRTRLDTYLDKSRRTRAGMYTHADSRDSFYMQTSFQTLVSWKFDIEIQSRRLLTRWNVNNISRDRTAISLRVIFMENGWLNASFEDDDQDRESFTVCLKFDFMRSIWNNMNHIFL